MKVVIRWLTRDEKAIGLIRKKFNFPRYTTVNGLTPGFVKDSDRAMFEECARRGFFTYSEKSWTFNGKSYSWKR